MRQLLPRPVEDLDPLDVYLHLPRPTPPDRPWLVVDMVQSLDGATAVDGRSAGLSGAADKRVFHGLRALADVILVGADTVRTERYGPVRYPDELRAARAAAGRADSPARIAVVTNSLDLDLDLPLFEPHPDREPPIVLTSAAGDPARRRALAAHAEVRVHGEHAVDLGAALAGLRADGTIVVCEGGPHLNASLLADDLVDEWCVSITPLVVGGDTPRMSGTVGALHHELDLETLLEEDGTLFGRWIRRRSGPGRGR